MSVIALEVPLTKRSWTGSTYIVPLLFALNLHLISPVAFPPKRTGRMCAVAAKISTLPRA
jgi:hypothetical protein